MKVGKAVRKAIDEMELGDGEAAMLHACNAIDGTARKAYSTLGNKARFTKLLWENADVLGPMGMPGINIETTRFAIGLITNPSTDDGKPDLIDIIYGVHRCTHGHGDELPNGFELMTDAAGPPEITRLQFEKDKARLSDRIVFGLLAVAMVCPLNVGEQTGDGYYLTFGANEKFVINDWWGRKADFLQAISSRAMPLVHLDFGDWDN